MTPPTPETIINNPSHLDILLICPKCEPEGLQEQNIPVYIPTLIQQLNTTNQPHIMPQRPSLCTDSDNLDVSPCSPDNSEFDNFLTSTVPTEDTINIMNTQTENNRTQKDDSGK